jgi:hypothetical protein
MVAALLLFFAVASCNSHGRVVSERKTYWENLLRADVPVGTDKSVVESWAAQHSISIRYESRNNELSGLAESIPVHDFVCSHWSIVLSLYLGANDKVEREYVEAMGTCL